MPHRINVTFEDRVWEELKKLPAGQRSRFINEAVVSELQKRAQRRAFAGIEALRKTMKPLPGNAEDWVREDRDAHR